MSTATYIAGGAAVVVVGARVWWSRRRPRRDATASPGPPGALTSHRRPLLGDTGLVAGREVRQRLRGRFFRVVTLVLLAVVAGAIIIPSIHSHSSSSGAEAVVGVVGPLTTGVREDVALAAKVTGIHARIVPEPTVRRARAALGAGRLTLVIVDRRSVLVPSASTTTAPAVSTIALDLGAQEAFRATGLTAAQASAVLHASPVPVRSLHHASSSGSAARSTSVIGLILTFVMLTQYLTWTLMGVMEEKTSRVVEVLLATVRPVQLLGGKVLGIGAVAMLQAAIVVAFALLLAEAVGSSLLTGTAPVVVVATLAWVVLGYAFYSWVYAAAGSMLTRQDQVQSLALPLSLPIIVGYVLGLTNAAASSASLLIKVLAYLPPTAPFAMPVLVAHGQAQWWEFLLSALISLVATVGVARLGAGVYRRAVLRTGRRPSFAEVFRPAR